jgi:GntR family transcriptional regulator, carbon starvation induced regulator
VSLSAIREALARLSSDGLVVAEPRRGFAVAPISLADLSDLTEVRIELETQCLRRSIARGDLAWEGRVVGSLHQLSRTPEQLGVHPDRARAHREFHDALVSACESVWRLRLRDQLFAQAERYRRFAAPYSRVERDVDSEHRLIADAALVRDAEGAARRMASHLQLTADVLKTSSAPFDDAPGTAAAPNSDKREVEADQAPIRLAHAPPAS